MSTRNLLLALRQNIDPKHAAELQAIIQQHAAEMVYLKHAAASLQLECRNYSGALRRTPSLGDALARLQRSVAEVSR